MNDLKVLKEQLESVECELSELKNDDTQQVCSEYGWGIDLELIWNLKISLLKNLEYRKEYLNEQIILLEYKLKQEK